MLKHYPFIHSVHVLDEGHYENPDKITELIGPSYAITEKNQQHLKIEVQNRGLDVERALQETDLSGVMEGLYIKEETEEVVLNRYKYIRGGFIQAVFNAEGHWQDKPLIPNKLKDERVMYEMDS